MTEIEIGGTTAGQNPDGYDQINVSGTLTLGGALEVILFGGFFPEVDDSFLIFTSIDSLVGDFALINGFSQISGLYFTGFELGED